VRHTDATFGWPSKTEIAQVMKRSFLTALLAGSIFSLASGAVYAAPEYPKLEKLVRAFDVVAFGSESLFVAKRAKLLKWDRDEIPVNLTWFQEKTDRGFKTNLVPETWSSQTWNHLRELEKLTGLKFTNSISEKKRPVLSVLFAPRKLLAKVPIPDVNADLQREMAAPGGCYFIAFPGKRGALKRSVIVVNSDRDESLISHCLLEELTQALGLPNDTNLIRPSIFSDHDTLQRLSPGDEILVRTLYHRQLTAGMERKKANRLARLIISQYLAAVR